MRQLFFRCPLANVAIHTRNVIHGCDWRVKTAVFRCLAAARVAIMLI